MGVTTPPSPFLYVSPLQWQVSEPRPKAPNSQEGNSSKLQLLPGSRPMDHHHRSNIRDQKTKVPSLQTCNGILAIHFGFCYFGEASYFGFLSKRVMDNKGLPIKAIHLSSLREFSCLDEKPSESPPTPPPPISD